MGRDELHRELVDLGALVPVEVEGVRGKRFVLAEELALLQAPPEPMPSVAFIAPFDSLLWDTALLASLFDFDYVWEGFFPPAKRRWGYYVLPIVFGDRFVGRIEPRIDRDRARVEVLDIWWEDGFAPRAPTGSSTRCAMRSARTCASPAPAASSGHPTSQRRSGSSSPAREPRRVAYAWRERFDNADLTHANGHSRTSPAISSRDGTRWTSRPPVGRPAGPDAAGFGHSRQTDGPVAKRTSRLPLLVEAVAKTG